MAEIKFEKTKSISEGYYPKTKNGKLYCSCGRELIQADENTLMCSYGYPKYTIRKDCIKLDKFGNVFFTIPKHKTGEDNENKD